MDRKDNTGKRGQVQNLEQEHAQKEAQKAQSSSRQNTKILDETAFSKNVGLAALIKDLETNNKCLRSQVMELYSLCHEKSQDTPNIKDEQDKEKVLESYKKSDYEIKTALTALNVHLNELVDRVNTLELRRTSIEKCLPLFNQNYQQTSKQLLNLLESYRKRAKTYKKNEAIEKNILHMSELMEKCHDEIQKVQGNLSLKQDEVITEKKEFFKILEKVEKFKFKDELLLKTQEDQASKLSSLVENQNQVLKLLQENKELQDNQKMTQEREKELSLEIADLQNKIKDIELEKKKQILEITEENRNIVNTLKNERDYEIGRAKKFEQLTIDTNQRLKEEMKQKNELAEKHKLLEEQYSELQSNLQRIQEKQSTSLQEIEKETVDRHKNWNITDSGGSSVQTATSFNSVCFSFTEEQSAEPFERKRKFLGRDTGRLPPQPQVKKFAGHERYKSVMKYTSSIESQINRMNH